MTRRCVELDSVRQRIIAQTTALIMGSFGSTSKLKTRLRPPGLSTECPKQVASLSELFLLKSMNTRLMVDMYDLCFQWKLPNSMETRVAPERLHPESKALPPNPPTGGERTGAVVVWGKVVSFMLLLERWPLL